LKVTDLELKQQLCEITTELYHAKVVTATGGNISVRSVEHEDAAWITPSQIYKGALEPDQMCLVDFDGKKVDGDHKPSVESVYHGGIFRLRPEINAVVHSHAPLATIFGMCDMDMLPFSTEAIFLMDYPVIEWYLGGTKELAKAVLDKFDKAHGAFLRNHGLITTGKNLRKAADATLMVEHTVSILLTCKMADLEPSLIPEKAVDFLRQFAGAL
jgi:L-fuculose-phosphate aldolase